MKFTGSTLLLLLASLTLLTVSDGQENVLTRIAPGLLECYENDGIFERDNRLPMTMNMLIELIRKVEDTPGFQQDIRQLSSSILHRFRQDGIVRAPGVIASPGVIPFSPAGFHFTKHRVLFSRLLPGNAQGFPNDTLTTQERCALHFMLSSSIDTRVRGDENVRCAQLSQYRAVRVPRHSDLNRSRVPRSNYLGDSEMMGPSEMNRIKQKFRKRKQSARLEMDPEDEAATYDAEQPEELAADEEPLAEDDGGVAEEDNAEDGGEEIAIFDDDAQLVDIASNAISACPVENGVVHTPWGTLSAGTVIAGIAAGLEPQTVQLRDLLPRSSNMRNQQQVQPMRVDNRWAATLSGDLAEVTLLHAPQQPNNIQVGASGAWNHTVAPRWYFLSQRSAFEMSDAEIRAGIDGLAMATNVVEWRSRANSLRLSQLLDMYYSARGVFNDTVRSCNRRDLFTAVAPIQQLRDQAAAFSTVLQKDMQLLVTLNPEVIVSFGTGAANALANYVPSSLNDLTCEATSLVPNDQTIWRTATDLYIFVDTAWPFRDLQSVVAHVLDGIDVGRFGTTYSIFNARDGSVIVNSTRFLADFHSNFTNALHQSLPTGLNLPTVMRTLRTEMTNLMNSERQTTSMSGRSKIALVIVNTDRVSEGDTDFAVRQLQLFREEVPDLRFLYMAGGDQGRFNRFVRDERRDVFPLRELGSGAVIDTVMVQTSPLIHRLQQEPRRIVNPRCGANWNQENWGSNSVNQYVEPRGIVFYRLHPNYFFQQGNNRRLRIQGHGFSSITVCHSRWVERPRTNSTENQNDINCRQINSESVDIDLSNACDGHSVINSCPSLFFSVEGSQVASNVFRCTEPECRFPDSARYAVIVDNLGCFSNALRLASTWLPFLLLAALFLLRK